ncbi:MAG: hypothetical protein M3082_04015 [Candidatus Dormibacteraeota bacterium]|nr:hypothetical protein [Candidatus Dormibacteraeota bacterium]
MATTISDTARIPPEMATAATALHTALCGSFRRDPAGLTEAFSALISAGCVVLSPRSLDFAGDLGGFMVTADQLDAEPLEIEWEHLAAIRAADFVWLHAPDGYVGPSATLELGFAAANGIPVFSKVEPRDVTLKNFVSIVDTPQDAVTAVRNSTGADPGRTISALQSYYARAAARRGYESESPQDVMLLLTEELGELARAVRKHIGLKRSGAYPDSAVGDELADVQLYLVHLANVLGIDMARAVSQKERVNHAKNQDRIDEPA